MAGRRMARRTDIALMEFRMDRPVPMDVVSFLVAGDSNWHA